MNLIISQYCTTLKDEGESVKYGPTRKIYGPPVQYIIMDLLGGWSRTIEEELRKLLRIKARDLLRNMQKSVVSNT